MRLWSLHPEYLDRQGLLACWREGLLAQKVLQGKTRGYQNHPQLLRFRKNDDPAGAVAAYLLKIREEAHNRGYNFNAGLVGQPAPDCILEVNSGQLKLEWEILLRKTEKRSPETHDRLLDVVKVKPHPLFRVREGGKEDWEKFS